MNIFIHHRDLRFKDNTTLIEQIKGEGNVTPIFVFDPKQIDKKKNPYFSDNLVQFMVQCIEKLNKDYKKKDGELYTFKGDYLKILRDLHKNYGINSIGFNFDYSPYAKERDQKIIDFCIKNDIQIYNKEDMLLHDLLDGKTKSKSEEPYKVFTPFKNNLKKKRVRSVNKFRGFNFKKKSKLKKSKYAYKDYNKLYTQNDNVLVEGGRKWALNRIKNLKKFNNYSECRDQMTYETTLLSASINFNVLSIREIYEKVKKLFGLNHGIINELYWRDFYYNILYFFPHIIKGSFKEKYDNIKWRNSQKDFDKWKKGETGYPLVDACMRQMNTTGYMHNRGRMIVSSFLIKNLFIDWRWGEKYFANKLVDYNISANNGGWQWSSGSGTDSQPYFRIFNVWTQAKKFDKECKYIKKWIPELEDLPCKDILNWDKSHSLFNNDTDYPKPMVDHKETRERALDLFKKYL
ncbi:FAD binding domain of DNA photolyase [seawater metagenome]|uniref:FAD binding domain of DNA photolyase n=1 Tax=seawater metagenome TaxID=1561972 RepID=A0A5E8CGV2_9ZZZZ